jgi:hypothetical protein
MSVAYCNICGRPSHCGIALWEDYRDERTLKLHGQVKVCNMCQCNECKDKDSIYDRNEKR